MTRVDRSDISSRCWRTDHNLARIVNAAREKAHEKHAENSIEAIDARRFGDWLAILGEEYGEVCHALTYDQHDDADEQAQALVDELVDLMAVASAWLDAWRVRGVRPRTNTWLASP